VHSISTSTFNGKVLTATHLHLISTHHSIITDYDSRPTRLNSTPILRINLVHLGKIIHISQEYIDFNDVVDARA
jgi:hypothetical protein